MAKLMWDQIGERKYETGISKGVLFLDNYKKGYAWNGLTSFDESPSGAEPNKQYADNINYLTLISAESFGGTIEAFTYPEEFSACIGESELSVGVSVGQQPRESFGFAYQTIVGNDVKREAYGYKIHLVYGCTAQPSSKTYETMNDSPEAITMSWEISTTPIEVPGFQPSATVVIDSTKTPEAKLQLIEDMIYGTEVKEAAMPTPAELITLLGSEG